MDKTIIIDKNKIYASVVIATTFLVRLYGNLFSWYLPYVLGVILLLPIVVIYLNSASWSSVNVSRNVFWLGVIPYIFGTLYTLILSIMGRSLLNSKMRAISVTAQMAYYIFLAMVLYNAFLQDTIDIIGNAMVITYAVVLAVALANVGITGLGEYISTVLYKETTLNYWFEKHDIGLSVGLVILYELFMKEKKNVARCILLLVIILLCFKKIAIFACIMSGSILIITKGGKSITKFPIRFIMLGVGIVSMIYVMLISSGRLVSFAMSFGVDFSGRMGFYRYMRKFYEWSPFFMGNGMGFTEKYMQSTSRKIGGYSAVHNDILKNYIDLGFVGSVLWILWYIVRVPHTLLRKFGSKAQYIYCILTIYAYIVYSTDNASEYYIFQFTMYSLILMGCHSGYLESNEAKGLAS